MPRFSSPLLVLVLVSLWSVSPGAEGDAAAPEPGGADEAGTLAGTGTGEADAAPATASPETEAGTDPVEATSPPEPDHAGPGPDPEPPAVDDDPCDEPGSDGSAFIDRVQRGVYGTVCGATVWVDSLFGTPRYDQDSDETYGRIGLYEYYDRRDAFDTRLRLRARLALPAMERRLRLTIGRGTEQELVEDRSTSNETPLPTAFRGVEDDSWLLGLGYSRQSGARRGFDVGAGAKLGTPLDPYVKGTYRHNFVADSRSMLRLRETVFWRDSRGVGSTTQLSIDRLLTSDLLVRWNNIGTVSTRKTEGLDWGSTLTLFQSLSSRRALAYSALVRGETSAEVPLQNYGVETRFRQQTFRRWLFIELSASLTWPQEFRIERREINPGVGIGFEMYFGPVPELELR